MKPTALFILTFVAWQAHALDYPHLTAEPQKTGWPLTAEERAYVVDKPEHDRRPGRESSKHLPRQQAGSAHGGTLGWHFVA